MVGLGLGLGLGLYLPYLSLYMSPTSLNISPISPQERALISDDTERELYGRR